MRFAPDITTCQRDDLQGAGLTAREIDDAVATLRLRMPDGFTTGDVFREATLALER